MSRTRGEGRGGSEKAQSVRRLLTAEERRKSQNLHANDDQRYADECGPVHVRRVGEPAPDFDELRR